MRLILWPACAEAAGTTSASASPAIFKPFNGALLFRNRLEDVLIPRRPFIGPAANRETTVPYHDTPSNLPVAGKWTSRPRPDGALQCRARALPAAGRTNRYRIPSWCPDSG